MFTAIFLAIKALVQKNPFIFAHLKSYFDMRSSCLIQRLLHWCEKRLAFIDEKLGGLSSTQMQADRWDKDKLD
ncbi:MAG: hypothetical protein Q4A50_03630 [Bacteroidales bacterium]|nr:hypothetical protein [Bacteroidales bacterium]